MDLISVGALEWILIIIAFSILCIPGIFYILSINRLLNKVQTKHQAIDPFMVWFLLIPGINLLYHFYVVVKVSESLENELFERIEYRQELSSLYNVGISLCVAALMSFVPFIGLVLAVISIILWILYWMKLAKMRNLLKIPFKGRY